MFAKSIGLPVWAPQDSRYADLYINELWLRAKFYNHISYSFMEETDGYHQHLKIYQKRPAIRLNIPSLAANLISRKLFAGKHAPRIVSDDENLLEAVQWMVKKARIRSKMLDAAYWVHAGACAVTINIVEDDDKELVPVMSYWQGRHCWPTFNDAEKLERLMIAYCIDGRTWLDLYRAMGITAPMSVLKKPIEPDTEYWYVRTFDKVDVLTLKPIEYDAWNPETGDRNLEVIEMALAVRHNSGFVPAVWIKNMPGGDGCDGKATSGAVLSNCIELDYDCSQAGRGGRYATAPQLLVKGRILNYERGSGVHIMGPSQMLQLPADRKDGDNSVSGADAKIIEMNATGLDIMMEKFITHIRQWTHEAIGISRKDPNTITGTMSGTAMQIVDEDMIDSVQVCRVIHGDEGYLEIIIMMALMLRMRKATKFAGISEDNIKDLTQDWPNLYSPSPQEVQFLVQAIVGATDGALIDNVEGRNWLENEVDRRHLAIQGDPNYKPDLKRKEEIEAEFAPKPAPGAAKKK